MAQMQVKNMSPDRSEGVFLGGESCQAGRLAETLFSPACGGWWMRGSGERGVDPCLLNLGLMA